MKLRYVYRGHEEAGFFVHALGLGNSEKLLEVAANNVAPPDGPYICIVPILDNWRMDVALARERSVWHYSEVLDPCIVEDIRQRRCALVFDLTNEGPALNERFFLDLLDWMDQLRIPAGQVVWLSQNRVLHQMFQMHSGQRSDWIKFEYYDFFVKLAASMFSPSSNEELFSGGYVQHIESMYDLEKKHNLLLCLNATPRLHRILTVSALSYFDLYADSLVSFPGMSYIKEGDSLADVVQFVERNPSLSFLLKSILKALSAVPVRVDKFSEKGNALATKVDSNLYLRTFFSLVTETDFSDGSIDRITEKIVKSFCMGHPTLVVGNPYSIKHMVDFGFQDWHGVLDISYDAVRHPAARFVVLFDELLRQTRSIRSGPTEWLGRVREVGAHNVRHAAMGSFLLHYEELYDRPIVGRLSMLVSN